MEELIGQVDTNKIREFKIQQEAEEYYTAAPIKEFRNWTEDAYHCFIISGDCNQCPIKTHYNLHTQCQMRKSLRHLVTNSGFPKEISKEAQAQKLIR